VSESTLGSLLPPELSPRGRPRRPSGRRRLARVLSWLAVGLSVVVLLGSGSIYLAVRKLEGNIQQVPDIFCKGPQCNRPQKANTRTTNYLIIGSDSRDDVPKSQWKRLGLHPEPGRRSDTMLLVHVPADRGGAYVLSFPRDLYVRIPGTQGRDRINAGYALGGPALAVKTVEALTDVRIDHYLEVNFLAFARMVDALGGVHVCVPQSMKSTKAHLDLTAGRHKLDGPTALAYVRARSFDSDSEYKDPTADIGRIKRQQQFIGAMIRRVLSSSTLVRVDRLARFLDRATKSLKADDKLKFSELKDLGLRFRNLDPKKVVFASVPYTRNVKIAGKWVLEMDDAGAEEIFRGIKDGTVLGGKKPAQTGPKLTVPPGNIRTRVLNGTDVKGQASKAATALRGVGFLIGSIGNADNTAYTETIVRHGPSRADSAKTLAAAIPGSRTELDPKLGRGLVVVIGSNYQGVKAVKVTPRRPSGPKQPTVTAADDPCAS
jgi:LCP family protein required for cell wall assembly